MPSKSSRPNNWRPLGIHLPAGRAFITDIDFLAKCTVFLTDKTPLLCQKHTDTILRF